MSDLGETDSLELIAAAKALHLAQEAVRTSKQALELVLQVEKSRGPRGRHGDDGYTPQKGKDYFDGKDGEDGLDGIGIVEVKDFDDTFSLFLSDDRSVSLTKPRGQPGQKGDTVKGDRGAKGADGVGIDTVRDAGDQFVIVLTNGVERRIAKLPGPTGPRGIPGVEGRPGRVPKHEVKSTAQFWKLRFEKPLGGWGPWIEMPRKQTLNMLAGATRAAPETVTLPRLIPLTLSTNTVVAPGQRYIIKADTRFGDVTLTLPARNNDYDMEIIVKKIYDDNELYVDALDGRNLNGAATFNISLGDTAIHFTDTLPEWDAT